MVTARQPHRSDRKIRAWVTLQRGVDTDDELVGIGETWRDIIFLEPVSLNEIAFERDRLLLILRRKEQRAHALLYCVKQHFLRLTTRINGGAGFPKISSPISHSNPFIL